MYRKSAALLMVLIIIAIVGIVALTLARSIVSGIGFTANIADSMAAEKASKAGLEYGLLQYKSSGTINLNKTENLDSNTTFNVTISPGSGGVVIESIGKVGQVQIKHTLTQQVTGGGGSAISFFTGNFEISDITSSGSYHTCKNGYVATGAGHKPIDVEKKQVAWVKCRELNSTLGLSINYSDIPSGSPWNGGYSSFDQKTSGNYIITAAGHWQSVKPTGTNYYREYPYVAWAKLNGATILYSSPDGINNIRTYNQPSNAATWEQECPDGFVMIGDGHGSSNLGTELERISCAPLVPQ